ncbi:hypothetical protein, partial [Micromonospora sp. DT229]|uniref:hypothetical protein n=1 Tax=Micromonospora sp. DT229 TaxID=3393430 RepID=UPI003CE7FE22
MRDIRPSAAFFTRLPHDPHAAVIFVVFIADDDRHRGRDDRRLERVSGGEFEVALVAGQGGGEGDEC